MPTAHTFTQWHFLTIVRREDCEVVFSEVLVHLDSELVVSAIFLSDPISVELSVKTAELVRLILAVVFFQMVKKFRCHMCVLLSSTNRGEHVRTSASHQPSCSTPHWEDNHTEESKPECETLLAALDPHGVEMHVELGCEITVENRVDIFQVVSARVLVQWVRLGVRSVPAAATAASCHGRCSGKHRRIRLRAAHHLHHQGTALLHYLLLVYYINYK